MRKTTLSALAIAAVSANGTGYALTATQPLSALIASQSPQAAEIALFHHENALGTSLELRLRPAGTTQAQRAQQPLLSGQHSVRSIGAIKF